MDIHEFENALEVTAELPGVSQNDVDLRIERRTLALCPGLSDNDE